MAEVFLAVQSGPAEFAKLVVQKRVRGLLSDRPDLGRGFLDEARLLARLSHPNLVQVLDLGWDERGPFVVIEYLCGETLLTILQELSASGRAMPWPLVARAIAGLAAGLGAAHAARDADGRPDPIVHRDLTPSNVVVCYSGVTKIIDFGIAKLAAKAGDTGAGTVKGKLSYLAPELLRGGTADRTSDLFQVGVLLFETLTGRRLFDAPNDAGRVQAVLNRPIPAPSQVASGLPPVMDRIVFGLLARDPDKRTRSADHVREQLEEALRQSAAHTGEHDVGSWLRAAFRRQFRERLERERDCLRRLAQSGSEPDDTTDADAPTEPLRPAPNRTRRRRSAAALLALTAALFTVASGLLCGEDPQPDAPPPSAAPLPAKAVPAPVVTPLEVDAGLAPADAGPQRRWRPRRRARGE